MLVFQHLRVTYLVAALSTLAHVRVVNTQIAILLIIGISVEWVDNGAAFCQDGDHRVRVLHIVLIVRVSLSITLAEIHAQLVDHGIGHVVER